MRRIWFGSLFWTVLIVAIAVGLIGYLPTLHDTQSSLSLEATPDVIAKDFNKDSLDTAFGLLKDLVKKEDERFKQIDSKANTFFGMFGFGLTLLTAMGPLIVKLLKLPSHNHSGKNVVYPRYYQREVAALYIFAVVAVMFSFFLAMLSAYVHTGASSRLVGVEIGSKYDLDPKVVYGYKYAGLPEEKYKRVLLAEYIKVHSLNLHANDVKARWLSRAQVIAFAGGVFLFGVMCMLALVIFFGPPRESSPGAFSKCVEELRRRSTSLKRHAISG